MSYKIISKFIKDISFEIPNAQTFIMLEKEILNYLNDKNIKLLSDDIKILSPIRNVGEHNIEINPYEGIISNVKIIVKKT